MPYDELLWYCTRADIMTYYSTNTDFSMIFLAILVHDISVFQYHDDINIITWKISQYYYISTGILQSTRLTSDYPNVHSEVHAVLAKITFSWEIWQTMKFLVLQIFRLYGVLHHVCAHRFLHMFYMQLTRKLKFSL